jgi:hypothetical protein
LPPSVRWRRAAEARCKWHAIFFHDATFGIYPGRRSQAVEHYEITRYGSLIAWAKQLDRSDCAALLQQNLDEEKAADKKLTTLAESKINRRAA